MSRSTRIALTLNKVAAERDQLRSRVKELEANAGRSYCAWCGEVESQEPNAILDHAMACAKRPDAEIRRVAIADAVAAEREACAKAAEKWAPDGLPVHGIGKRIAAAIRARGET